MLESGRLVRQRGHEGQGKQGIYKMLIAGMLSKLSEGGYDREQNKVFSRGLNEVGEVFVG